MDAPDPDPADPVTAIRNIGPATAAELARAGIATADELRALGTDAAYARLLEAGTRPHFIAYYVIEMGLQGRSWNDCKGSEKVDLRARFDRLVATHHDIDRAALERILDQIGVRRTPPARPRASAEPARKRDQAVPVSRATSRPARQAPTLPPEDGSRPEDRGPKESAPD
jgi:DNA transformation protein and related proteins